MAKAKGPGAATRREFDYYPTPPWMTDLLLDRLACTPAGRMLMVARVLEPCVGAGNIVRSIAHRFPAATFVTNDLDPRWPADHHLDAGSDELYEAAAAPDWIITNPPFSEAARVAPRCVRAARIGVAMLLRVTWLEPIPDRAQFLAQNPPAWELVMQRYSFRQNGDVDSAPAAWFVWSKHLTQRIEVIPLRGPQLALGVGPA